MIIDYLLYDLGIVAGIFANVFTVALAVRVLIEAYIKNPSLHPQEELSNLKIKGLYEVGEKRSWDYSKSCRRFPQNFSSPIM